MGEDWWMQGINWDGDYVVYPTTYLSEGENVYMDAEDIKGQKVTLLKIRSKFLDYWDFQDESIKTIETSKIKRFYLKSDETFEPQDFSGCRVKCKVFQRFTIHLDYSDRLDSNVLGSIREWVEKRQ